MQFAHSNRLPLRLKVTCFQAIALVVAISLCSSAHAARLEFSNLDHQFVWRVFGGSQQSFGSMQLDLPASQQGQTSAFNLTCTVQLGHANSTPSYFNTYGPQFVAGPSVTLVSFDPNIPPSQVPTAAFLSPGSIVDSGRVFQPSSLQLAYQAYPGTAIYPAYTASLPGGYWGFRFPASDGMHYGFVQFGPAQGSPYVFSGSPSFIQPLSWGIETTPGVPYTIVPAPPLLWLIVPIGGLLSRRTRPSLP